MAVVEITKENKEAEVFLGSLVWTMPDAFAGSG